MQMMSGWERDVLPSQLHWVPDLTRWDEKHKLDEIVFSRDHFDLIREENARLRHTIVNLKMVLRTVRCREDLAVRALG